MARRKQTDPYTAHAALLLQIAERHLFLETLETRNCDSLDFHEHAVWAHGLLAQTRQCLRAVAS